MATAKPEGPKQTRGTIDAVACPWCKKPQDLRDLSDFGVEPGSTLVCDFCKRRSRIARVQPTTLIWLTPT